MFESMITKFLEVDSTEGSSSQPLKEFEESSSRWKSLIDVYNCILSTPIEEPMQQVLENPIKPKSIPNEATIDDSISYPSLV